VDSSRHELKVWLDGKCNLGLDLLEYALELIEQYDKEFQKRAGRKEDSKDGKEKQPSELSIRFNEVKSGYKHLVLLQKDRALEFVMTSFPYKYASERLLINERVERSYEFTCDMYNSLTTKIVVPVCDKILLIYDTSLKKASLVLETIQTSDLAQKVGEKYTNARITLASNWMRLDLNNDGKVTLSDIIQSVKSLQTLVKESQLATKAIELRNSMYKRAIGYLEKDKQEAKKEPLAKPADHEEDENSSDSIELKSISEKDD